MNTSDSTARMFSKPIIKFALISAAYHGCNVLGLFSFLALPIMDGLGFVPPDLPYSWGLWFLLLYPVFLCIVALFGLHGSWATLKGRRRGPLILGIANGLAAINVPFGTALAVYSVVRLWGVDGTELTPPPDGSEP